MKSPLVIFTYFYFIGGLVFVVLYGVLIDPAVAWFLAVNWLAAGLGLAFIVYGIRRKSTSAVAGFIYYLGIAWLILLLAVGAFLISNDGIGVQELQWLLG